MITIFSVGPNDKYELEICPMPHGPAKGSLMELSLECRYPMHTDSYIYIGPLTKEELIRLGQTIIDMASVY